MRDKSQNRNDLSDVVIIACCSFDPITGEEIRFLERCKSRGDWLIVGLYSDSWLHYHAGGFTQTYEQRKRVLEELRCVDEVFTFDDSDGTACQLIRLVRMCYTGADIIFMSNMDKTGMPETKIKGIKFEVCK